MKKKKEKDPALQGDAASAGNASQKSPEEKRAETRKTILQFTLTILITLVVCLLFVRFVAVRSVVDGSSMNPTLYDGDNLILEKVSYYFHQPERFDVIVFELEDEPGTHYIKRVIGLPGETVQIRFETVDGESVGVVYINGEKLEGDVYGIEPIKKVYAAGKPITLKEDEFFVMGDNRNNSHDSRSASLGPIKRSQILGRALFRFWPLNQMKIIGK